MMAAMYTCGTFLFFILFDVYRYAHIYLYTVITCGMPLLDLLCASILKAITLINVLENVTNT
jgi:hypothetical protein